MLHWETLVRLSFKTSKTSKKIMAWKVHLVEMDPPTLLTGNLFAQAPAQLQAQVPAQLFRESTMWVTDKMPLFSYFVRNKCVYCRKS